ncbi:MAG: DUF3127 domain-containing protein [Bacteroides sp.]|nr:DUF3127 domain-containing protein [Bacteroides sp.]
MKTLTYALLLLVASVLLPACIEDGITTSTAHQPEFSTDTLKMGAMFTDVANRTFSFRVYNRHDKVLNISSIRMKADNSVFRLNVDGTAGTSFNNIEIRPNDSIFVFVAVTLPPNGNFKPLTVTDVVEFVTNGQQRQVVVQAEGTDVERLNALTISSDTRWSADRPRQVFDSLVVAPGATLTIEAGSKIYFHDGATLTVHGSLICQGAPGNPVEFTGDRTGNVVTDISFDLMSRQWEGIRFTSSARNSAMDYTEVRNTWNGVTVDSTGTTAEPVLTLRNSRLRNAAGNVLNVSHATVHAFATEFAEAGYGAVSLTGGSYRFIGCTFSNCYLFSAIMGPLLRLSHVNADTDTGSSAPHLQAELINCILYGSSADIAPGDLTGTAVTLNRCLLRSDGTDDDNFINCIWNQDPLFHTVRADYIFDYRPYPDSPAVGQALPGYESLSGQTDFYGAPRTTNALGAYEPTPDN